MSKQKGFDPLASLFDLPEAPAAPPPPPARGDDLPEAPHAKPSSGLDPAALAKAVAKAAAAKAGAPAAPATPAPAAPAPTATDPAELAKALAKAALARAGAPAAPAAPAPKAAKPAAPKPAAPAGGISRLMSAAPPPRKALSAEDALRAAAESEAQAKQAAAERPISPATPAPHLPAASAPPAAPAARKSAALPTGDISDLVAGLVQDSLPDLGPLYVPKALLADDRGVLTALWRAHRARFCQAGDVAGAIAVSAVLRALAGVPAGRLAVAYVVTDHGDFLVWVDLSTTTLVAGFKDARAWFAGSVDE